MTGGVLTQDALLFFLIEDFLLVVRVNPIGSLSLNLMRYHKTVTLLVVTNLFAR